MQLSPRETVVYGFASRGYTGRYIAEKLSVSPRTIEHQLRAIYQKCGVTNRDELIEWHERSSNEELFGSDRLRQSLTPAGGESVG